MSPSRVPAAPRRNRVLWLAGLAVALLCAGVLSYFASASPDGLERVAEHLGFAQTATHHASADGPLADYQVKSIDHPWLSGGLAGVIGALVVLVCSTVLVWLARGRRQTQDV